MKKVNNLYQREEFQLYGLKWEFMRRNPQYVAHYYKYFKQDGTLKSRLNKKDVTVFFVRFYQLFNPLNPDLSFLKLMDELYQSEKVSRRTRHWENLLSMEKAKKTGTKEYELEKARFDESIKDIMAFEGIYQQIKFWACGVYRIVGHSGEAGASDENVEEILKKAVGPNGLAKILVDVDAPLSNVIVALKDELWWDQMRRIHRPAIKVRNSIDKLKKYLKVYALREETKWSFDRIAKKLYPKEHDAALGLKDPKVKIESLVKRVNEHYLQAKWYIDGGFREIR
ncbi:MAG: hypothetical protein HQL23_08240 [Candidatus Omnitrophica bacterium]|nr:hypothetical protein [Candidatus Omnitrophota bacterium]